MWLYAALDLAVAYTFQLHYKYNHSITDAMIVADASLPGEVVVAAAVRSSLTSALKEKEKEKSHQLLAAGKIYNFSRFSSFQR